MSYLSIENFTKSFGTTEVLKGIDLELNKGEVVSIIGSSGSGKTTFLRCINFLESPDSGKMTLDNQELLNEPSLIKYSDKILREKRLNFGLVFQSFNLFPQYTVFKNLTLAPSIFLREELKRKKKEIKTKKELKNWYNNERKKIFDTSYELLKKIGLEDKYNFYPYQLSGGQCQRVAIARALALKPKILCFDEPTSALDPELTGEVLKVIKSLKDEDKTMIIVTHEMDFAKNVSDKVIFMADGKVEEVGLPLQIFENPKSEKLKSFLSHLNKKDGENNVK